MKNYWLIAIFVLIINLPFGFWRVQTNKFSRYWFLAVHIPVPIVILLRLVAGTGLQLKTLPIFVCAFLSGQFLGGKFYKKYRKK
ncbi:MAG: hypothetical protein J7K30_03305 [Deltaproteobacteria bacterium]|nr:hypothetical protein [Deltaproteobacteria bacterium]